MSSKKETQEENPLVYYAIIILAIGIVAYKWLSEIDKTVLIQNLIYIGIELFATILFLSIMTFSPP